MYDRRLTDMAELGASNAATPTPAVPPASTDLAAGPGDGPAGSGLGALWASLGQASRRTLGMLTAAMISIIVATIGAGLYTTERYADLAYAFRTEQTRTVLDMALADLVWNDYRQRVGGLAGAIAGEIREPFAAGDRTALSTILADAGRRDVVSSGAIGLLGAQVLDLELATLASGGSRLAESGSGEVSAPVAEFLWNRSGNDRLVTEPVVWLDDGRPVMTMVAPLGGLRLAGYLLVHADLVPALAGLDNRVGLELVVRGLDGTNAIAALDEFRNSPDAVTRPARLWLHGPAGVDETADRVGGVIGLIQDVASRTSLLALNASIEAARAGEQGRGFAVVATEVEDLAGQTAEATQEIASHVTAMGATIEAANDALGVIGSTVRRVAGITETVDEAVDGQQAATVQIANDIGAVVEATEATAGRLGAIVEGSDTAGEATAELMAGAGQLGHEARALLGRVDAMLDRLRAA